MGRGRHSDPGKAPAAVEQAEIQPAGHHPGKNIGWVLDHHAAAEGGNEKQEIHRRMAAGKRVMGHSPSPFRRGNRTIKNAPKRGAEKAKPSPDRPQESVEVFPYSGSGRQKARVFSEKNSNDPGGVSCPSTAAWYRWDLPIPRTRAFTARIRSYYTKSEEKSKGGVGMDEKMSARRSN